MKHETCKYILLQYFVQYMPFFLDHVHTWHPKSKQASKAQNIKREERENSTIMISFRAFGLAFFVQSLEHNIFKQGLFSLVGGMYLNIFCLLKDKISKNPLAGMNIFLKVQCKIHPYSLQLHVLRFTITMYTQCRHDASHNRMMQYLTFPFGSPFNVQLKKSRCV